MDEGAVVNQILKGSQKAGKTYRFDQTHDAFQPADLWFQHSDEGRILFVVLGAGAAHGSGRLCVR